MKKLFFVVMMFCLLQVGYSAGFKGLVKEVKKDVAKKTEAIKIEAVNKIEEVKEDIKSRDVVVDVTDKGIKVTLEKKPEPVAIIPTIETSEVIETPKVIEVTKTVEVTKPAEKTKLIIKKVDAKKVTVKISADLKPVEAVEQTKSSSKITILKIIIAIIIIIVVLLIYFIPLRRNK